MRQHKIIFRADGSPQVGYGHVHRLLSLAQMLHKSFECVFVSHESPDFLLKELELLSIPFIKTGNIKYNLADERRPGDEIAFDMDAILHGNEIVVLDGYWFGKKYLQAVKDKGCTLVYIDDLIGEGNIADVIINHSMGVSITDYKMTAPATCIYTGSNYSLINIPEKFKHQSRSKNIFSRLLISMGGADPLNFTCKILEEYTTFINRFDTIKVIAGNAYQHADALKTTAVNFPQLEILQGLSKEEVFTVMQQSSAAILPASTMAIEYASIGGLLAVVKTADNQQYLYRGLIENKVALPVDELSNADEEILKGIIVNQQKVFDGNSGKRFAKLFGELQLQLSLSFVKATKEHLDITFKWASDPAVRAYSFNQNQIILEEHQNWFLQKIEQPNCMYLLGKIDNDIVGSLRFDIKDSNAVISYLVSPQYHGKGFGRILLAKGLVYLSKHNSTVTAATGYVMQQNTASVKVFERLGFTCTTENNQLCFTKNIYR